MNEDDQVHLRSIASIMRNAGDGAEFDVFGNFSMRGVPLCQTCLGPISSGTWPRCFPCGQQGPQPSPPIYFLSYSGVTDQSRTDMARYKEDPPSLRSIQRLRILLYFGLQYHLDCIAGEPDGIDVITYVPSGRSPVSSIPTLIPGSSIPVEPMVYRPPYRQDRAIRFETDKFYADPSIFEGKRVLLIEDSWFKGHNARSAAAALLEAGAARVAVLVLARRLGRGFQDKLLDVIDESKPFDPMFCPVSLARHE